MAHPDLNEGLAATRWGRRDSAALPRQMPGRRFVSIVLEAPIPKRSFGDKTSLYVIYIYIYTYSDKQQLSHKIGWPVTHMHTYMRVCRPRGSQSVRLAERGWKPHRVVLA